MKNKILTALIGTFVIASAPTAAMASDQALAPYEDGSNITLSGIVSNVSDDEFKLNIGNHIVDVDFDNWDWLQDVDLRNHLQNGQQVVVSGEVDKDWFDNDELEADNIYFQKALNYYYVTDRNPAYYAEFNDGQTMRDGNYVSMRGTVQSINGQEFELSSQDTNMTVDMASIAYKPQGEALDLTVGDRVFVFGEMDKTFFDNKELSADAVIKVNKINKSSTQTN